MNKMLIKIECREFLILMIWYIVSKCNSIALDQWYFSNCRVNFIEESRVLQNIGKVVHKFQLRYENFITYSRLGDLCAVHL
jgi:hypothetical protein